MNKENKKPKFTIRSPRRRRRDVRHHNPGTKRRPPTPRVRVLSSITLVPPRDVQVPMGPSTSVYQEDIEVPMHFEPPPPSPVPWVTPTDMVESPRDTTRRNPEAFIPEPQVNYEDGEFRIVPGEAYGPVPLYINRDIPWKLEPLDMPPTRRVRFYRNDSRDPRMHDLRVEVVPHIETPPESTPALFEPPHRPPIGHQQPTSDVVTELITMLDRTYGCPRPQPHVAQPETPPTPQPVPQSSCGEATRFSDSLEVLLSLARLFEGPSSDTLAAYRRYKRPSCARRN